MELVQRPDDAPKDSKGATADTGKYLQAVALAGQLGKTVEEVLAFMGNSGQGATVGTPPTPPLAPSILTREPQVARLPLPVEDDTVLADAKSKEVSSDGFVVTEIINPEDASEQDLAKLSEEEDDGNDWSGKIRIGSRVRIIYQVNASRINWVGKRGKVVRIIGNEAAKVFEVEFSGKKVPIMRLNKKTNKIEKGYKDKPIINVFSEDQIELAD